MSKAEAFEGALRMVVGILALPFCWVVFGLAYGASLVWDAAKSGWRQ